MSYVSTLVDPLALWIGYYSVCVHVYGVQCFKWYCEYVLPW